MTKNDLIDIVAKNTKQSVKQTKLTINAFLSEVENSLKKGNKVGIIGFGAFDTIKRKARNAQNPKTGAKVKVPAKTTVRYKAGANLQNL
jgi:DNA-binding protein HU-beta